MNQSTNNEAVAQEIFDLQRKVSNLDFVRAELEDHNECLKIEVTKYKTETIESVKIVNLLKAEISKLQFSLEDEKLRRKELEELVNENAKESGEGDEKVYALTSKEEDGDNIIIAELQNELEDLKVKITMYKEQLEIERAKNLEEKENSDALKKEMEEIKSILESKSQQLVDCNESLEALREEKILLATELASLKSSSNDINSRGNSLFAEVEDKRKVMSKKLKDIQTKYQELKKAYIDKNIAFNRLKEENVALHRKWDDEKEMRSKSDSRLIAAQEARMNDLMDVIKELEKRPESPQFVTLNSNDGKQMKWVNDIVDSARKEVAEVRKELHMRSLNIWMTEQKLHEMTGKYLAARDELMEATAKLHQQASLLMVKNSNESQSMKKDVEVQCSPRRSNFEKPQKSVRFGENVNKID